MCRLPSPIYTLLRVKVVRSASCYQLDNESTVKSGKWEGDMVEIIKIKEEDTLILQLESVTTKENIIEAKEWFKNAMGINVAIIDGKYKIAGIKENGKRIC